MFSYIFPFYLAYKHRPHTHTRHLQEIHVAQSDRLFHSFIVFRVKILFVALTKANSDESLSIYPASSLSATVGYATEFKADRWLRFPSMHVRKGICDVTNCGRDARRARCSEGVWPGLFFLRLFDERRDCSTCSWFVSASPLSQAAADFVPTIFPQRSLRSTYHTASFPNWDLK